MNKNFIREKIYYIRTKNKKTARGLSLDLLMSSEYINQVENGRITPSLDFIIKFCDYFSISLKDFFDEEKKYVVEYNELFELLNDFSQEDVDKIIEVIKILKNH